MEAKKHLNLLLSAGLVLGLAACGGDDDDESDGESKVNQVSVDTAILTIGQSSVTKVEFSFSSDDVFDDDENVVVLVRLPDSVRLQPGTSEIKRPIDDRSVEPQVFSCADNSTLLQFDLDEDDLLDAENPSGDADAEIRFTVDAAALSETGVITAAAANNALAGGCATEFVAQGSAAIIVR